MNSMDTSRYFSFMEYLEFLFCQNLPGDNEKSKEDYYSILKCYLDEYSGQFGEEDFKTILSQSEKNSGRIFHDVENHYKVINRFRTRGRLFRKKNLYPLLLKTLENIVSYSYVLFSVNKESCRKNVYDIIDRYANKKDFHLKLLKNNLTSKECITLDDFLLKEKGYTNLKIKNVVICANMSAGKSTLVNALLGSDVLPARNEATTAKITTVLDRDGLSNLKGTCQNGNNLEVSYDVDLETIEKWNSDKNIDHIYLQGDLDGIKNTEKYAVQIHDTPGTNNSIDDSHCKITLDFLNPNNIDLLLYVANFEQLMTNDEQFLLKEIRQRVIEKRKIPVLFIVNKVDSYDKQREDYDDVMKKFDDNLKSLGYEKYEILPVASRAARLFKMALKGKASQFTENERDEFSSYIKKFTKRMNINDISPRHVTLEDSMIYGKTDEETVEIGDDSYEVMKLREALMNTGLIGIEKTIEEYIG